MGICSTYCCVKNDPSLKENEVNVDDIGKELKRESSQDKSQPLP